MAGMLSKGDHVTLRCGWPAVVHHDLGEDGYELKLESGYTIEVDEYGQAGTGPNRLDVVEVIKS